MNKYKAIKTEVNGQKFDSKREAARYSDLILLELAGEISHLERQVKHPLIINSEKICTYIADFVYLEDGVCIVEDCKGMRTPTYKLKKKLMRAIHGIEIRET